MSIKQLIVYLFAVIASQSLSIKSKPQFPIPIFLKTTDIFLLRSFTYFKGGIIQISKRNPLLRRSNPQNILIIFIETINVIARQGKRSSRISMNVHEIIGLFIQDVYAFTIGTYPNITIPIIYDSFYNIRLYSLFARKLKHLSILNIITL